MRLTRTWLRSSLFEVWSACRKGYQGARYQPLRPVSDNHLFVICYDGRFDELPDHVREQGPWQGMHRGEIEKLKASYRRALARDGYALVKKEAVFKPEV